MKKSLKKERSEKICSLPDGKTVEFVHLDGYYIPVNPMEVYGIDTYFPEEKTTINSKKSKKQTKMALKNSKKNKEKKHE